MKNKILKVLDIIVPMIIVSFIIWLISRKIEISIVWILSPFWMMFALFVAAFLIGIIRIPFVFLFTFFKNKKEIKNESNNNSEGNVSEI